MEHTSPNNAGLVHISEKEPPGLLPSCPRDIHTNEALPLSGHCQGCAGGLAEVEQLRQQYKARGKLVEAMAVLNAEYAFKRGMRG